MQIVVVGKPNTGKSTFFSAATMVDVAIANRPFVTIKPNQGTSYVSTKCVHPELGKECQPQNSKCVNGTRLIPITLFDVAGLIEGAWQGKGLGNQFLNDIMQAQALIHVLDTAGTTDAEGNSLKPGSYNPANDVRFLEKEISYWVKGILTKNWDKISKQATSTKQPVQSLAAQLAGLGITENDVKGVFESEGFSEKPSEWNDDELLRFAEAVRGESKPIIIAANKMDLPGAQDNLEKLRAEFPDRIFIPCCAEAELALRKAERAGIIEYVPGSSDFKTLKMLPDNQLKALQFIKENVLDVFGSTGVQEAINKTAFELLNLIVAYPVEDQHKWISGRGHILPDTYLLPKGSTAYDLAVKIHSSFGERFVAAIDCKTGQKIARDAPLKNNDVVKIQLSH